VPGRSRPVSLSFRSSDRPIERVCCMSRNRRTRRHKTRASKANKGVRPSLHRKRGQF
jgi:hypothetical protein